MKELFEEAERQLGATVSFANDAQRDRFITLLGNGVRGSIHAGLVKEIHETIIPAVTEAIRGADHAHALERLQEMEHKLNAMEIEFGAMKPSPPDAMDDVLKEHRDRQEGWR